ncbi:MAG: helix-turn-helix transcriptional regulator [Bacteroidia bacterium]|nr:helix-turn-helix transcriptional regulator [Bacteroidia bacterium]
MEKSESLEELYRRKFHWVPEDLKKGLGHFNVFKHEFVAGKPLPYRKRDYFKITLLLDKGKIHYADKTLDIPNPALIFSNPQIPYQWEHVESIKSGVFCIFNQHFFHQFGKLEQYSVFQPSGNPVFELTAEQIAYVENVFQRMFDEINSEYIHKYDLLRNLVFELVHFAMKMQPSSKFDQQQINASQRISTLFLELLERQFPVDENHPFVNLRTASDFASQLNIHVNHLNRAVKAITDKTTTQIIGERILQESKIMLRYSTWNVSEIAYALGFKEVTHFNNFFKKHTDLSPLKFRNILEK